MSSTTGSTTAISNEIVDAAGLVGARRFQRGEEMPGRELPPYRYLTIYDLGDDPADAVARLSTAAPSMTTREALRGSMARSWVYVERNT
jgi:hypothetical protein